MLTTATPAVPSRVHAWAIDIRREDGTPVRQSRVEVDWEPAREWVRLLAIRRGLGPGEAFLLPCAVEPCWEDARGAPYLEGARVTVEGLEACRVELGTDYFRGPALKAVAALVEEGALEKGDRVRWAPLAFPAPGGEEPGPPPRPLGRMVAPAIPIRPARLDPGPGPGPEDAAAARPFPVRIPGRVLEEVGALTRGAGPRETGGLLIGHLCRDAAAGALWLAVTAQVPARHVVAEVTKLTFSAETWTEARAAIALRNREEIMVGWWHSHPVREWCKNCPEERRATCALARGFLSEDDRLLHRTVFPRAYSVALVASDVNDAGPDLTLFGWQEGLLAERGFDRVEETT